MHSELMMSQFLSTLRGMKNGGWVCPTTWKLNFTDLSIRIDYTLPPQFTQAALMVAESVPKTKMLKKNFH